MEKYRQFADGGTGVNPFVPVWSHHKSGLVMQCAKLALLPLALLRLCMVATAFLWLVLAELLCWPLGFLPIVRRPLHWLLSYAGCSLALLGLGFWFTAGGHVLADHRRLKLAPPKVNSSSCYDARRGCLVLSNTQGLTDVLYLGMRLCPVFVFPAVDGSPVPYYSVLGALRRAGARRASVPVETPQSLKDIAEAARTGWRGPVVVFPEGARTNGTAVLAWKKTTFEGLESFEKPVGTALVTLEYNKAGAYTPHHTIGTMFKHILFLCIQPFHSVKSTWLPATDVATVVKGKPVPESMVLLRSVLTRMIAGAVEVDVYAEKHQDFMAFWEASQKKGYTKATKKS
ncbi:unnamed protein product [Symbiodinium microadriaticum]|nr:unnamed protein product [Symbiodinium microadriaticum]CAE7940253.1 unnamed protein product [Symbiodinium sp. KB8]